MPTKKSKKRPKNLPHPFKTCECNTCRNIRCTEDLEIYNNVYNPPRHLDVVNDEGVFVPITPSGYNKHDYQETTSDAQTLEILAEHFEEATKIVYWKVVELTPIDGGDFERILCIREREEDAQKVLDVLNQTDINWSCYGIRRIVEPRVTQPLVNSFWNKIIKWVRFFEYRDLCGFKRNYYLF